MELTKTRYKKTEVGLIPEDWSVENFGEKFTIKNGLNKAKEFFGYGTPIVNYMDVYGKSGLYKKDIKGKVFVGSQEIRNYNIQKGDLLFTRTSETPEEIGMSSAILEKVENTVFSGFVLRARPTDETYNNEFKKYCFRSNEIRSQIIKTCSYTTRALTNGRSLSVILIPTPPLPEQKAIAEVLSDVDSLLQALEQKLAKKRVIKQGAMQKLLTPKEDWKVKKLGDFLDYEQPGPYIVASTEYNDNYNTPVLTAGKTFILGYTNEVFGIFENGPVIIFDDFTTATKFVDFNFKVRSSAMKILKKKDDSVNIRFIYDLMQLIVFPLGDHKRHWIGEYQHIDVSVPNLEEQSRIATILSDMDKEIELIESQLAKYRVIKQGLMQELLTGRIRLIV